MQKRSSQTGSAHAVIIICLVLALITALGWIFYQNFIYKTPVKETTKVVVVKKQKESNDKKSTYTYVDYRKDKQDGTGIKIASPNDVDTITNGSDKLKTYLKQLASQHKFIVDRVYGDYATGSAPGHYAIWGPKDGSGAVEEVAGTQNLGMKCSQLEAAKVPSELVDSECYAFDGSNNTGPQPYTTNPYR